MNTGFYDLHSIKCVSILRKFYNDAIALSHAFHIDMLDCNKSICRERCTTISITEYINKYITLDTHNVCIDRSIQHTNECGEVGSTKGMYYLFIYLSLNNLKSLINKYNLKERKI